jgi:uncharacterized membrane protein YidH (DUF202 family)
MNRATSYLILFGIVILVISFIRYSRDGKAIRSMVAAPEVLASRQSQKQRILIYGIAIALGSFVLATILDMADINVSPLALQMITTSVLVLMWLFGLVISTWRLRNYKKRLELSGGRDEILSNTIEAVKSARLRWALLFGLMAGASLLSSLSALFSAAAQGN